MTSIHNIQESSTPKRRRLGLGRYIKSQNSNLSRECSPIISDDIDQSSVRNKCESPLLPCNQTEFRSLCDSENSSNVEIPGSPDAFNASDKEEWESLYVCTGKLKEICENSNEYNTVKPMQVDTEVVHKEIINSKIEQSVCRNIDKGFMDFIEESFDNINQSICNLDDAIRNQSILFETRDSFLLDVKEEVLVETIPKQYKQTVASNNVNTFYGLPLITKGLFKTYRNIEKFYDWQEECLNLESVRERRNLIYALPTSGGKTLVAEVLMLREVLNRKKNALFILPFVAIVQEKIWGLSPFAVQLDFLVEEYAAGKGHLPPKKRRKKNSIYIATIEKGLALIRSLIELDRLNELGLIVVDELHLIGEKDRGGTLETLLTTVLFTNKDIQIVGMSATIGNLHEIAQFLHADVFQRDFRPVELTEYVKLGDMLHKIVWKPELEIVPDRKLEFNYTAAATSLDPDYLGGLVSEVVPKGSCLVFCPTKRNCENVATLLCKLQRIEMISHKVEERKALESALKSEGANIELTRAVRHGIAYHHAGLSSDERLLLEQAYRSGVISVICCTSTLAAGVNLPAQRVILRAPLVGRQLISLAAYRQMVGRAGRAGVCDTGESVVLCGAGDWERLRSVLAGGLAAARSVLVPCSLLLAALGAGLQARRRLRRLLRCSLRAVTAHHTQPSTDIDTICDEALRSLIESGAVEVTNNKSHKTEDSSNTSDGIYLCDDSILTLSEIGRAAVKGGMELSVAKQLLLDMETASKSLVLMGSLHLLYLVTPHDAAGIKLDYAHYYSLYSNLDEEGIQTAKILGITEANAIRMVTGKPIKNVSEMVLGRFYLALMLRDLWNQVSVPVVSQKYMMGRGSVQVTLTAAATFAHGALRVCEELPALWSYRALLAELGARLQHCAAPELQHLMELPAVRKARAMQLLRAGYKRVEDLAKASAEELMSNVSHLSRTAANQLISAARLSLIEKIENLRAEAEEVMEELNV